MGSGALSIGGSDELGHDGMTMSVLVFAVLFFLLTLSLIGGGHAHPPGYPVGTTGDR